MASTYSIKQPDMSRRTDLAGRTVSSNGMNVTYDSDGYAVSAINYSHPAFAGTDRGVAAPSVDRYNDTGGVRGGYGGSSYDQQYMSTRDLQNAAFVRQQAQNGLMSWADANAAVEGIRARYGYAGGSNGAGYTKLGTIAFDPDDVTTQPLSQYFRGNQTSNLYGGNSSAYALALAAQKAQHQSPLNSLQSELRSLYNGQNSAYMQALAEQNAANKAAVQKATNSLEAQKTNTNQQYADLFRQLYINKMKQQKNIGQQMAAQGVTGGAAESTLLGLGTQYEDALRKGEQGRLNTLSDLDKAISDARLTGDITNAEAAASMAKENVNSYASVLQALIAQQNTERQLALSEQQHASDRAASNRAYAYQRALQQLSLGLMPDDETLTGAEWTSDAAKNYVAAINEQKARELEREAGNDRDAALSTIMSLLSSGVSAQNIPAYLLEAAGLNVSGASALASDLTAAAKSYSGSGRSYSSGGTSKPALTAAQALTAIKEGTLTKSVLDAYEYYYGEPYGEPYGGTSTGSSTADSTVQANASYQDVKRTIVGLMQQGNVARAQTIMNTYYWSFTDKQRAELNALFGLNEEW